MKKIFFCALFLIYYSLSDSTTARNNYEYNKNLKYAKNTFNKSDKLKNFYKKYGTKNFIEKRIFNDNKDLFKISPQLNNFFNEIIVSIETKDTNESKNGFNVNIDSNTQTQIGTEFIAEGNVIISSNIGILKTSKFTYDQESKIMKIEGNIFFKTTNQYLSASKIKYDFLEKKGFIKDAFGSINFKKVGEISNFNNTDILSDNFEDDLKIKNVVLENSSKLDLSNGQDINADINPMNRSRFKSKLIEINNDIWTAKELQLTNDPFNYPQLIVNNKDFKLFIENDETRIKTKWSSLIFENKLTIPLGPRNINIDRKNYFRWGLAYDKDKYDGFYIYRSFNTRYLDKKKNTQFDLITKFNFQRAIKGTSQSFSAENESVLGKKIVQDSKNLDFIGLDAGLTSSLGNWDYVLKAETNSLDINKLDKIFEGKTFLNRNINFVEKDNFYKRQDFSFFGIYREKTKNGSLGEILVNSSYGANYDLKKINLKPNMNITNEFSIGYGRYESISYLDQNNILANNRLNVSLKQKNEYLIWKPKYELNLTKEYKYSPNIIPQGFYWVMEGNLDFFRYEDGNKQDLFLIKSGPKLILGEFKNSFFDYTELGIYPRFKFNNGESPFIFDQIVDNKVVELSIRQRLYKSISIGFSGEFNLENDHPHDDRFINPVIEVSFNRRAYKVSLNYNLDLEEGGLKFNLYSFGFDGLGEKF